jgi:hypothetical protein
MNKSSHIGGVDISLYDIQNRDVAGRFTWRCGHHTVLGLKQTPHDIEDGRSTDWFCLVIQAVGKLT